MHKGKPRLCVIGNLLGRNSGFVTTQGQIIADLFQRDGYDVISASSRTARLPRLAEIVATVVRNRGNIDVLILEVYSGLSTVITDVTGRLCRLFGIRTIFVLHGGNLPNFTKRYPRWMKGALSRADILAAPSPYLAGEMEKFGFEVRVIPNVVDAVPADFRLRRSVGPRLIWMRSFHANYNPEMAIRTLALLKREHPDATLVMAGVDKGLEAGVKEAARAAGLEHSVRFPGFLDRESKLREFANADIYLNTNRIDNTPVSVIEACSMGLPVVATNVGGISQLLTHRETGLLVGDDRPDEMAEAIMELIRDPDLAERLSANGKILSDRSSWDAVRRSWSGLFDELAERSDVPVGKHAPDAVHHGNV